MGGDVRLKGVVYTGVHQDVNVQGDIKSTHVYMAWTQAWIYNKEHSHGITCQETSVE